MAILKIARMGHPILARPADEIADPTAASISALIDDMVATLDDADGAGLAAPQVHVPLRLVLVSVPSGRLAQEGEEGEDEPLIALINPTITPLSQDRESGWEACLSLPGLVGYVPRWTHIHCRYQTPAGEWVEREAKGFFARVLQHECDHLDGVLYPMRMEDMARFGFVEEMRQARRDTEDTQDDEQQDEQEAADD
ncbi:MAG: peptide deformylase [Alphaproteobacteria bacterium]